MNRGRGGRQKPQACCVFLPLSCSCASEVRVVHARVMFHAQIQPLATDAARCTIKCSLPKSPSWSTPFSASFDRTGCTKRCTKRERTCGQRVKPRIAPYKTRQTLPGCRAPLNANEEEHEGLWAARKSANHRGNLRRPRIGVCWRHETLVSAGGYGVPSRRYRPRSLALASPGTSACTVSSVRSESCHMHPGVCARRCEERGLQERGRVLLRAYPVLQSATTFPRV